MKCRIAQPSELVLTSLLRRATIWLSLHNHDGTITKNLQLFDLQQTFLNRKTIVEGNVGCDCPICLMEDGKL